MAKEKRNLEKISIAVPVELLGWIDEMVEKRVFANRSHAIEVCILKAKESMEQMS